MKKQLIITVSVLLLFTVSGCESFTDADAPQSQLTSPAVYESVGAADAAVADIYARIRESGLASGTVSGISYLAGIYSDEFTYSSTNIEITALEAHTHLPTNSLIQALWNSGYAQIYAANAVIQGLEASTSIEPEEKNRLTGEALFLRAYLHFQLANLFGDIPYVTSTDYTINASIGKMAHAAVIEAIANDLSQAQNLLPETNNDLVPVRAVKPAAAALLARVYLYAGEWQQAESTASAVIENPVFTLVPNPADVFLKESTEAIWSLHPGIEGLNTKDARTFIFTSGPPTKAYLSESLVSAFEAGDLRKAAWVKSITSASGTWQHSFKYKKTTNTGTSQEYTIMLRLSEQFLIRAEARAQLGLIDEARSDLDIIRNRAGLAPVVANGQEALLEAIYHERRVELFAEQGHRWFDLVRTGTASQVMGVLPAWEPTDVLMPLPQAELLLNANLLPQNPGY